MINDKKMIINDRHAGIIGAILGILKALFSEQTIDFGTKLITTLLLGATGSLGAILGKKLWVWIEKKFKK